MASLIAGYEYDIFISYRQKDNKHDGWVTEFVNYLAWFLIDKDRNIKEGMGIIDKALQLSPNNFNFVDTKGWGLYKQGKFEEALDLLEKAWNLRPVYSHEIYLHLEAAKKAVAGQKNN